MCKLLFSLEIRVFYDKTELNPKNNNTILPTRKCRFKNLVRYLKSNQIVRRKFLTFMNAKSNLSLVLLHVLISIITCNKNNCDTNFKIDNDYIIFTNIHKQYQQCSHVRVSYLKVLHSLTLCNSRKFFGCTSPNCNAASITSSSRSRAMSVFFLLIFSMGSM